jgi:hypothetical protein
MEQSFSFEAKTFCLSAKVGCPNLCLEERRKGFVGYIFASIQCSSWLMDMVEAVIQSQVKEEIAKSYRGGDDKAMMVHGGGNKAGRFLEVLILAESGHKGVIWLLEGRFGRGWRRFVSELQLLLEAQVKLSRFEEIGDPLAKVLRDAPPWCVKSGRLFVQALRFVSALRKEPFVPQCISTFFWCRFALSRGLTVRVCVMP